MQSGLLWLVAEFYSIVIKYYVFFAMYWVRNTTGWVKSLPLFWWLECNMLKHELRSVGAFPLEGTVLPICT